MHKLRLLSGVAMLVACLAPAAHADEWTKLTYFTFSAPVELPGMVLPAGTYKFELADPDASRRVVRISEKEGGKIQGIFLSIPDQQLEPSDKPLVMFKEAPAGAPEAVKAWFYPGETMGYEFVYPHDQALKIAKSTHSSVLTAKGDVTGTTLASDTTRIDENDRVASATSSTTTTSTTSTTTTTTATAPPPAPPAQAVIEPPATVAPQPVATPRGTTITEPVPVGTSGEVATTAPRRHLPGTASPLPLMELFGGLSIAGGFALRALRKALA
jgi:hypothetical protein